MPRVNACIAAAFLSWLSVFLPGAARAQDPAELVRVELIAEPQAVRPGQPFWVGIRLSMKEHWHTYWRNPGDSGLPTEVAWSLPPGFSAGEIVWPTPSRIAYGPLANFGFEGQATLLTQITPPADLASGDPARIAARVSYLVCERICIPGEASVSTNLTVAGPDVPPGRDLAVRGLFDAARASLPQASPWPANFSATPEAVTLKLAAPGLRREAIRSVFFFPHSATLIENATPQTLAVRDDGLALTIKRSPLSSAAPDNVDGVLVIDEEIGGTTARQSFALNAEPAAAGTGGLLADVSLAHAALFALLGGLILNLMPCVFPVLSIKILHLTKHSGEPAGRVRLHGLAYTAGVLASFVALAAALFTIRAGGAEVGWGFQLQSPLVVALLAYVLFAMGLSLSGAWNIGTSLAGAGTSLAGRSGLAGSFFTGVLATIVATPCTAPFMGIAIGFAVTQPPLVGSIVFLALGFGLALPFLALSFIPALHRRLPRPGAWMETLKQLLAFPLYATVAWLVWVLSQQVGPTGLLAALCGLVLVALAAWSFNAAHAAARTWPTRLAQATALVSLLLLIALVRTIDADRGQPGQIATAQAASGGMTAEPFSQARLDALVAAGDRPVFINMTAAWCLTCMVNERVALSSQEVRKAFAEKNIAYLKGDWTNRNPEITRVLERHARSGVPLYLLYGKGADPVILPQILTESILLEQTARL